MKKFEEMLKALTKTANEGNPANHCIISFNPHSEPSNKPLFEMRFMDKHGSNLCFVLANNIEDLFLEYVKSVKKNIKYKEECLDMEYKNKKEKLDKIKQAINSVNNKTKYEEDYVGE